MTIQERLQMVLKMHNLSASAFADKIGVQRSNMSHILSGRNKPSLDFLEKTLQHFPKVNAKWLICGQINEEESNLDEILQAKSKEVAKPCFTQKKPVKLVEIYSDGSFKEFFPNNE
jgi:transcriptional regulator with XRE-family HTH domain